MQQYSNVAIWTRGMEKEPSERRGLGALEREREKERERGGGVRGVPSTTREQWGNRGHPKHCPTTGYLYWRLSGAGCCGASAPGANDNTGKTRGHQGNNTGTTAGPHVPVLAVEWGGLLRGVQFQRQL